MPTKVSVLSNGPIRIEGDFEILDPTGCDGAHARTGFNDPVSARDLPPPKPKL
jgi:hypothetical protein